MELTAVFFDYSGVLTTPLAMPNEPPFDAEAMLTFMVDALTSQAPHAWHELERGELGIDAWIDLVEEAVPGGGVMFDPASPLNAMGSLELLDAPLVLARELKQAGHRVGVLTNNVAEWQPLWRPRLPADVFDVVVDSADVGMRKPESAMYRHALRALGVQQPGSALLIDDFEWNVAGAEAAGMLGLHYTPDLDLRAELVKLHLLG